MVVLLVLVFLMPLKKGVFTVSNITVTVNIFNIVNFCVVLFCFGLGVGLGLFHQIVFNISEVIVSLLS